MRAINTFWNWFQDNNKTIQNLINETPKNQKHISFWITKNLSYYCKEIDFILVFPNNNNNNNNNKTELIITANGNPEYFNQVIDLVDNAPQLKNWKFTAFIQPTERIDKIIDGFDEPYIFQDITLKASELKFIPLDYDKITKKIDIMVFLKNYYLYCDTKTLEQAVFIIRQDILGENSLFQNINLLQLAQPNDTERPKEMPDNETELIHLYDFQMFLDILNVKDFKKAVPIYL
jgi:hypothetical protein